MHVAVHVAVYIAVHVAVNAVHFAKCVVICVAISVAMHAAVYVGIACCSVWCSVCYVHAAALRHRQQSSHSTLVVRASSVSEIRPRTARIGSFTVGRVASKLSTGGQQCSAKMAQVIARKVSQFLGRAGLIFGW